jgi:hypothetical protein
MVGLPCLTDQRLKYLEGVITAKDYEKYCSVCGIIVIFSMFFHSSITASEDIEGIRQKFQLLQAT